MLLLLLILVVLFACGGLPQLGWHTYGYAPSLLGLVLVVILVVALLSGRW